jgi:acetyl esterase/lipase
VTRAGSWPSPLSAEAVAGGGLRLAQPSVHGEHSYWLEGRPSEGGRVALLRADRAGRLEEVTPPTANVRTRVNEYGGGAYLACDAGVFFVDDVGGDGARGQVHRVVAPGRAEPLTRSSGLRFADLALDAARARLVAVCEDPLRDPHRPLQRVVAIALADGALTTLAEGRDFYASPRPSPDGARLVFLAWDLPAMPWAGAELHAVAIDPPTGLPHGGAQRRAGPAAFQPEFSADGALWWSEDAAGRFALVRQGEGAARGFPDRARDCALPLWNLNMRCFVPRADGGAIAASVADGLWQLRRADAGGAWRVVPGAEDLTQIEHLAGAGDRIVVLAGGAQAALAVHELDLATGARRTLVRSSPSALDDAWLPQPEPLVFEGEDGGECHALFWPPRSATHALGPGERPPLLLRCHGGPTAAASSALDARTLFWTSRGWAVLDVDYRGSWGYGRDYRRALDGRWGELDAADAVASARHAIERGHCDPARIAITGSSAGGLTALNALTLPGQPFASAGVHYGIADLVSAMRDTHKFESGYGETLLGAWPAARQEWERRSPLARLERLRRPCIFFQGLDDKVVPPDQTERIAAALAAAGVRVAVQRYAGEGHGFRGAATVADALARELEFHLASFAASAPPPGGTDPGPPTAGAAAGAG